MGNCNFSFFHPKTHETDKNQESTASRPSPPALPPRLFHHTHAIESVDDLKVQHSPLTLQGSICLGYCTQAYDGDTCTINMRSKFGDHQWKIRLIDFDAPEMKTKNPIEKKHAIACRDTLLELIGQKYVIIECGPFEKYGRLLATVYVRRSINTDDDIRTDSCVADDIKRVTGLLNVNQWMLKYTSAVPYNGGTKAEISYDRPYHCLYMKHLK